jgi:hypothetical protein
MKAKLAILLSLLVTAMFVVAGQPLMSDSESPSAEPDYTSYWFIGEDAANTTVHIYSKHKTDVTFSGTNGVDVEVEVGPREFANYNVEDLDYGEDERWFYLEINSDDPIMTVIHKEILLRTGENEYQIQHGDKTGARPATSLQTEYFIANGDSGSEDDILVVYAPEETTFTAKRFTNDGEVFTQTVTVDGIFVTPYISLWLGPSSPIYEGYSMVIESEDPIAVNLFEQLPWWPSPWGGADKYMGSFGTSVFYDDYLSFEYRTGGWTNIYTPDSADVDFRDKFGDTIETLSFTGESSASVPTTKHEDLGYPVHDEQPFLVRTTSDEGFVNGEYTPVETEVLATSTYMGYNTSNSFLELYSFVDAEVTVVDGQTGDSVSLSLDNETLYNLTLVEDLGFDADAPFLLSVLASEPVYQQIRIPVKATLTPYTSMYLRHYPIRIGPPIPVDFVLDPRTLNLDSKGKWVTAYLTFPEDHGPGDVDIDSILLQEELKVEKHDIDGDTLILKFSRKDLQKLLQPGDEVVIEITGEFNDGLAFYGTTTIRVIKN